MNKYTEILKKYWGYDSFRPLQEEIISSVVDEKKDILALLPTGGGKSIIYQVAGLSKPGICIVVTPLIALMKDQVDNLLRRKIKAVALHSGLSRDEIDIALDNCAYGHVKFLYISPERIETELFQARLMKMKVNLIAIDEAHCISQWGYDFRPSYLKIALLRKLCPQAMFLALTATATHKVTEDIQDKLQFKEHHAIRSGFERENLIFIVRKVDDKFRYLLKILNKVNQSGIIYVRNRRKTYEIAKFLLENKLSADYYHAGLSHELRDKKQHEWTSGKTRIMVSTNAFGMGIDKPDVRVVIHLDIPDSPEAYYQEAGRAGRDGKTAYAVLLYNKTDVTAAEQRFEHNFPPIETIRSIYEALCNYLQVPVGSGKGLSFEFSLANFASQYNFNIAVIYNCLKILQYEGYIELTDELFNPSRIRFIVSRDDLYKFQVANEKFDAFVKLLLRVYAGLFTEYSKIDEEFLAKKAQTKRQVIYDYLVKLSRLKIINYIPQSKSPLIIFTESRLETKSVILSHETYKFRKERYGEKNASMIQYATQTCVCRASYLLQYFGEKNNMDCGKCDICEKSKEKPASENIRKEIIETISQLLSEQDLFIHSLVDQLNTFKEEDVVNAIRWLLDQNKLYYTSSMKLSMRT